MRDLMLGPRNERGGQRGDIPLERYSDGGRLTPVADGIRCYPLGLTYEKPTTISAPNANSKVLGGVIDPNTEQRAEFMKVSWQATYEIQTYIDNVYRRQWLAQLTASKRYRITSRMG